MRPYLLLAPVIVILVITLWFAYWAWTSVQGPPMPAIGYLALGGGVAVSLIVGIALMTLLFYSNRHGYDEIDNHSEWEDEP